MIRNSPEAIEQAWDHLAAEYVGEIGPAGRRAALAAIEMAAIVREIPEGDRLKILDAGGGGGYHAVRLAQLGHSVTVVHISSRMLELAEEAARDADVQGQITTVKGDIQSLDAVASERFDMVISCGTVVSDCGSPLDALRSFRSMLQDKGTACFSVRSIGSVPPWEDSESAAEADPQVRVIPGHQAFDWHLFSRRGIERLCQEAWLSLLRVVPVSCEAPPKEEGVLSLRKYVKLHLTLTDDEKALSRAVEMLAVAEKWSETGR